MAIGTQKTMATQFAKFGTTVWIKFPVESENSEFCKIPINYCNIFEDLENSCFSVTFRSHDWSAYEKLSEIYSRQPFEFAARNWYGDETVGVQGLVLLTEKRCISEVNSVSIFEFEVKSIVIHSFVEPTET